MILPYINHKRRMKSQVKCQQCGKIFLDWITQGPKFCSRRCYAERQKVHNPNSPFAPGSLHPNWKGGVSSSKEYKREYDVLYKGERRAHISEKEKERYLRNRTRILSKVKEYRLKNPDRFRFFVKLYKARRRGADGSHTREEWENLKAKYNWTCPSCKRREPDISLTEDHVIPLSKGGSNNIENLQPLCRSCNTSKGTNSNRY